MRGLPISTVAAFARANPHAGGATNASRSGNQHHVFRDSLGQGFVKCREDRVVARCERH